ncbi:MAG TPA: ABC transporter permease [Gemmatimonadaceae bacterium]|nr:ABC transporter permease [Gemmatimonadaceae bacterium]
MSGRAAGPERGGDDRWLRYFDFLRRDPRRDVDDELAAHLEMRVADLVARGLSAEEAHRRALAEFGDVDAVRAATVEIDERVRRRARRRDWIGELARDARVAVRSLRRSPAYALTAVLCAALGIGVTSAVVSATYAILLRPLPYSDPDRLVAIYEQNPARAIHGSNISWPDYVSWRDGARSFAAIGMWTWSTKTLVAEGSDAERIEGADVTANLFPLLGVSAALGRGFTRDEETPGRDHVVVLSDRIWRARFGGQRSVLGTDVRLDGVPYTIVGVMPPRFNFPDRGDLWVPFSVNPANEARENRGYAGAIGRLAPGVTLARANADLHTIDAALARQFPDQNLGWSAELVPMRDDLVGDLRAPLHVFLAAVGMVLLMVCANVANLMLARGAARARELAVRHSLGASRRRLVRQLMTESLVVVSLGGVLGALVAWWGLRLLRYGFPDQLLPFYISLRLDGPALAVIAGVTVLTGLACGIIPAVRGTRLDAGVALRDGGGAGTSLHRSRLRGALVAGEIALSVVLLVGALLLTRSYRNYESTDLGFDPHGVVAARLALPRADYPHRAQVQAFYARLLERLQQIPGVTGVGSAQGIPFNGWDVETTVELEGTPPARPGEEETAHFQSVTPGFLPTLGVGLVRGRWLTADDRDTLNPAALVNERMVATIFGGRDPIGRRLRVGGPSQPYATVVGVVRDYRHYRLPQPMHPAVYLPYATYSMREEDVVVRTSRGEASALVPALRGAVRELDPRVALYRVQTLDEAVSRSLWRQRLQGHVVGLFAALALALACVGLYGVVSYAVAQRTRELGVRMALGASRGDVLRLVFAQSGRLVGVGVVIGLAVAWGATRALRSLLYGVQPTDLATFAAVPACLTAVALLAVLVPARRAARIDPTVAMRAE